MKKAIVFSLAAAFMAGCGGSNTSQPTTGTQSADGNWAAAIANPLGQPGITFTFTMAQSGGSSSMMNMSNLQMTTLSVCFGAGSVMTGQMGGGMMGAGSQITMDMWSDAAHTGNHLNMVMTMNATMDGMTGTYTLTGGTGGCVSSSGTITMTRH